MTAPHRGSKYSMSTNAMAKLKDILDALFMITPVERDWLAYVGVL
jgi:hypothetical protein